MVDASTLLMIVFVLVDDWYQAYGQHLVPTISRLPVLQPSFSDSEILTLRILLRQRFGIDVLTFEQHPPQPS